MARSDVFAMKESGLDAFLFAEIGLEMNGSPLTVLSMLARLGQDPWTEAARWSGLPEATVVDTLTTSIGRMPLSAEALSDARATATRLIRLLPSRSQAAQSQAGQFGAAQTKAASSRAPQFRTPIKNAAAARFAAVPKWVRLMILCGTIAFGLAANYMMLMPGRHAADTTPIGQGFEPTPPG